eukprot:TRINITY_DN5237_c0_g1_i1.p1 TRINITY_DN5237_c0_g1~~TRINITY_DN5237_c0_g1_i1.p1  ORF type:complete len:602 (-),score=116.80 TRINITY_DN5237_c0_g1_i1:6-1811(-)
MLNFTIFSCFSQRKSLSHFPLRRRKYVSSYTERSVQGMDMGKTEDEYDQFGRSENRQLGRHGLYDGAEDEMVYEIPEDDMMSNISLLENEDLLGLGITNADVPVIKKTEKFRLNTELSYALTLEDVSKCFSIYKKMLKYNIVVRTNNMESLMDLARRKRKFFMMVGHFKRNPRKYNPRCWSMVVQYLLEKKREGQARMVLNNYFEYFSDVTHDQFVYNHFINYYSEKGDLDAIMKFYGNMKDRDIIPNNYVFGAIIGALVKYNQVDTAYEIIGEMLSLKVPINNVIYNTIITGYIKQDRFDEAINILSEIKYHGTEANFVIFSNLISGLSSKKEAHRALMVYNEMKLRVNVSQFIYIQLIPLFFECGMPEIAFGLLKDMKFNNIAPNSKIYKSMIIHYANTEEYEKIDEILDTMKAMGSPVSQIYILILKEIKTGPRSYGKIGKYYRKMLRDDHPNISLYLFMFSTCYSFHRKMKEVDGYYEDMINAGITPNPIIFMNIIRCAFRCEDVEKAYYYFQKMSEFDIEPNHHIINEMVGGLLQYEMIDEALALSKIQKKYNMESNQFVKNTIDKYLKRIDRTDLKKKFYDAFLINDYIQSTKLD